MSVGAVVDLYCLPGCAKCASVQRWLNRLRLLVVVHDVAADDAARAEVERLGFRSLPVVVTSGGRRGAPSQTSSWSRCRNWPKPNRARRPLAGPAMWWV
ncbi:MAG: glutaredoxin domain-containing protein [Dermatophilaceae bacterium]